MPKPPSTAPKPPPIGEGSSQSSGPNNPMEQSGSISGTLRYFLSQPPKKKKKKKKKK